MARIPLLQLSDIHLGYGGDPLFHDLSVSVAPGDRLALVGRNGSGKSTLMRIMADLVEPDSGTRATAPGLSVGYMEQDPDFEPFATLGEFAAAGLEPGEGWRVEAAAEGLGLDPARDPATASGGERRRAALARLLAQDAGLMLLDEPTNHLDIAAVDWLEGHLARTRSGFVLISHDRAFLRRLSRGTLWLDRGRLRRQDKGFEAFEAWRDTVWDEEDLAAHKLDRKIRAEARWAVEGISARRKRNQGRVRALADLRAERAAAIRRQGAAALDLGAAPGSGKKVIEARDLSLSYDGRPIVSRLDLTVQRGDRLAIVGPNGVGKTSLIRLLLKREAPDAGEVRHGTNLAVALFDQTRAALDPDLSLWETLVGDADMQVSGKADQVMVRGQPRHVLGYLKEFLFAEDRARAPVRALSGGEKARLLLARLMAKESNLLVLDEPTNDLDIETLDLLQEVLDGYDGTVIVVSHDRDFLDRVATITVAMEGRGGATVYAGGWSDMMAQRDGRPLGGGAAPQARSPAATEVARRAGDAPPPAEPQARPPASGPNDRAQTLSYAERHRLDSLPAEIDRLTAEIGKLEDLLATPGLYNREPVKFAKATEALAARQAALAAAEDDWLALEEKAEAARAS